MKINEVTEKSRERAKGIAERDGGFLVPVYAVVKTNKEGRIISVTHDHLIGINTIVNK
ncbi:hypothetical protein NSQ30_10780 [Bacillus sp. FSL R7-0651]|uniref:hypothetical protein n=1 Tax=Bacillus TaxID=1386 RepID=UPI001C218F05|nr:hypothetical protein [Bacillus pumilus]MBU8607801.1 hypothetical protein [Bacillus pumilus]